MSKVWIKRRNPVSTRKPRYISSLSNVKRIAYRTARVVNRLSHAVDLEEKFLDWQATNAVSSTAQIQLINDIDQGDGDSDRSGNSIFAKSVQLRMTTIPHASATWTFLKWAIVLDKEADAAVLGTPTYIDIFNRADVNVFVNMDNSRRFTILRTGIIQISPDSKDGYYLEVPPIKLGFKCLYEGATGSTDYKENALFLVLVSNESTNAPTCNRAFRFRYMDN